MSRGRIVKTINQENDSKQKKNTNSKNGYQIWKTKFKNQMSCDEIKYKIQLEIINVNTKNCK
jgi:hypothetical protein